MPRPVRKLQARVECYHVYIGFFKTSPRVSPFRYLFLLDFRYFFFFALSFSPFVFVLGDCTQTRAKQCKQITHHPPSLPSESNNKCSANLLTSSSLFLSLPFTVIVVDFSCLAVAFYCCWSCCCCCSDCCCIFALAFSKNRTNHKKYHGKYSQTQPTKKYPQKKRNIHKLLFSLHNESTPISREIKQTRRNKSQSKIRTKTKHTRITYLKS